MHWYLLVLQKYAVFHGRARRAEFWWFFLINGIVYMLLALLDGALGWGQPETGVGVLSALYTLATALPGLAVTVRRLHDGGNSGWWVLIGLVPMLGTLVLLVLLLLNSTPGDNAHGPNPRPVGHDRLGAGRG